MLRRLWSVAGRHRRGFVMSMAAIPIVVMMGVLRPLLIKEAIDVQIVASDYRGLRVYAILFLAAVVFETVAMAFQVYWLQVAGHKTIFDLRTIIFRHVIRLPATFFDKQPIGNLLSRSTSDVEALGETLSFGVFTIITDLMRIAGFLVAMFALDWRLTIYSLSIAPLLIVLVRLFSRVLRNLQLEIRRAQGVQTGYLAEQLNGLTAVQLHGREHASLASYVGFGHRYLRATKMANIFDALLFSVMEAIAALCVALLLYVATPRVLMNEPGLTVGLISAFVLYLQRIFIPVREFSGKLATLNRAAASLERMYRLLDLDQEPQVSSENDPLTRWSGGMRVRDLSFRYRDDGVDVINKINFDVRPGEVVAIVGRTGSGKTSLGRILTRTYEGYRGSVTMLCEEGPTREVELRDISPGTLRDHVLMVQQDVFLFDDTTSYNVSLGQADLVENDARIRDALATVQALESIDQRGGLNFEVGERGRNLSVGEAQMLAFARVAARRPQMLILDEATASVDSATEIRVQAAIEKLLKGRTVLVIAHRLSTVRHADKILVMSDGQIAEQGNHSTLMAAGGLYAELYNGRLSSDVS